jgi:DNA invertase Pin-like site-specific DNA recombinase
MLTESKAAQYLRMSTDMQRYSIENQSEAIGLYAARRGLTIVRSYEDAGRSGLRLDGRAALQTLLSEVRSGRADFRTILVYDVSRWGRFQDSDESAYYEFLCKEAGVKVEYCAEQFENDGSLTATVLKNIKRAMAGEFSRELSTKVFAGQSRIVASGFHIGSTPGYGLRRHLLDVHGNRKMELAFGSGRAFTAST